MGTSASQRRINILALLAMLLLALLPTAGRLLQANTASSNAIWAPMCTMNGLKLVRLGLGDADTTLAKPHGHGIPSSQDDCPYCPVLSAMAALALCVMLALPASASAQSTVGRASLSRAQRYPCGLGSRGPPIAS